MLKKPELGGAQELSLYQFTVARDGDIAYVYSNMPFIASSSFL